MKAKLVTTSEGIAFEGVVDIENTGSATAQNCYIEPRSDFGARPFNADEYWKRPGPHSAGFETKMAIHPGRKLPFLGNFCPKHRFTALEDIPSGLNLQFLVFAEHSEPLSTWCLFSSDELLRAGGDGILRQTKVSKLKPGMNYLPS